MAQRMPPFFDDDHAALRARARKWAEENLFASANPEKPVERRAVELVRDLGAAEFLKFVVPRQFGGARDAIQARDLCILREELARGDALADTMLALQALGGYPIARFGSAAQKRRYLGDAASGTAIAAFALTEPEAGSDAASMQTRAMRRDGDFSMSGIKCFISNAGIADFYVVFASTAPERKGKGVSAFLLQAGTPGMTIKENTELLSPHPMGVIEFTDCIVESDALLGAEGAGLQIAFATLDLLRCTVGAAAVGLAQRALDEAIASQPDPTSIWPRDRRVSRHRVQARRDGHGIGSSTLVGLSSGVGARLRRQRRQTGIIDGEALRDRSGAAHRRPGAANSRRRRFGRGQHHGAALPRRARFAHLRRHLGNSEGDHCAGIAEGNRQQAIGNSENRY